MLIDTEDAHINYEEMARPPQSSEKNSGWDCINQVVRIF